MSQFDFKFKEELPKSFRETGKTDLEQSIEDADNGIFGHAYEDASDFRKHLVNKKE